MIFLSIYLMYHLSDYDYILPEHLIAQYPAQPADHARLLIADVGQISVGLTDAHVYDLPALLDPHTLMILNDTKVIKARIPLDHISIKLCTGKETILDQGEIFVISIRDSYHIEVLVSDGKHFRPWSIIYLDPDRGVVLESIRFTDDGILLHTGWSDVSALLEQYGQMPLPPYIAPSEQAQSHYQTHRARHEGSVAAPTASLHLTPAVISKLRDRWIRMDMLTLHVGISTFKPLIHDQIQDHDIHAEQCMITRDLRERIANQKQHWHPILSVGTTVTRTLESMPYIRQSLKLQWDQIDHGLTSQTIHRRDQCSKDLDPQMIQDLVVTDRGVWCQTKIFIMPGRSRRIIDQMMTNFHLPRTSLLVMIAVLTWYQQMREIYDHAIREQYRFYSYGDAMLIRTKSHKPKK